MYFSRNGHTNQQHENIRVDGSKLYQIEGTMMTTVTQCCYGESVMAPSVRLGRKFSTHKHIVKH